MYGRDSAERIQHVYLGDCKCGVIFFGAAIIKQTDRHHSIHMFKA